MAGFWDLTDDDERLEISEAEAQALANEHLISFDSEASVYRPQASWFAIEQRIYLLFGRDAVAEPR